MNIAHITDFHLRPYGDKAHGVADTAERLTQAVSRLSALRPAPDLVVATGDLADYGRPEDYRLLRRILAPLPAPLLVIPGNRDDREALRDAFGEDGYLPTDGPFLHYVVERDSVRLIGLDTVTPGSKWGCLCPQRLGWLETQLGEAPEMPVVILMHHPPFLTGVPFMDGEPLEGAAELEALVSRAGNVGAVLCGHLHRPIQRAWAGTIAAVAPAVAFSLPMTLDPDALGVMLEPPAGLLHVRLEDGAFITHALPLAEHPGPFPFQRHRPVAAAAD